MEFSVDSEPPGTGREANREYKPEWGELQYPRGDKRRKRLESSGQRV